MNRKGLAGSLFVIVLAGIVGVLLSACGPIQKSQLEVRQEAAQNAVEVPVVTNFVERQNIQARQELFDNPAQVSWIYCLAENGQVVFFGSVEGKVTSSGKRLEPTTLSGNGYSYGDGAQNYGGQWTTERMQADGTFGHSDSYVYWFDPAGNYYQWSGPYFLTSVPIKIDNAVLNVRDVTEGGE